jgi:cytochrome bd-type quinol oxidase subunit 1
MLPEIVKFIMLIIMAVLSFTAFFMLRYMRKHPPRNDNETQKV